MGKVSDKRVKQLEKRVEDCEREIEFLKKAFTRHNHDQCDKKVIFDCSVM